MHSLDEVASSHLSSHIKTALSAILVAGSNNALQAVDRLIGLRKMVECFRQGNVAIGTLPADTRAN